MVVGMFVVAGTDIELADFAASLPQHINKRTLVLDAHVLRAVTTRIRAVRLRAIAGISSEGLKIFKAGSPPPVLWSSDCPGPPSAGTAQEISRNPTRPATRLPPPEWPSRWKPSK
jgi:hypothetical protein